MEEKQKQELLKDLLDSINRENLDDSCNHKDIIEYFFNKKAQKTNEAVDKVKKYLSGDSASTDIAESLENLIEEHNFFKVCLIDELNKILCNHSDLSITQFQIEKERERLNQMVSYDTLTSVSTRDTVLQNLRKSIMLFTRNRERIFSLLMLDIDFFKKINDTFGHIIGDEILKIMGQILNICLRESDVAGRFGGEEFLIILTDTNIKSSLIVADRIKVLVDCIGKSEDAKQLILGNLEKKSTEKEMKNIKRIINTVEESIKGGHSDLSKAIEKMTISIGITQVVDDDMDFFKEYGIDKMILRLIDRADKALYHSKDHGRNSISIRLPEKRIKEFFDIDQCSVFINSKD